MPQPTDTLTGGIFWMTMALMYGFPLIGWVITLIAMRTCNLEKEDMAEVQKRIAEKKQPQCRVSKRGRRKIKIRSHAWKGNAWLRIFLYSL